MSDGQSEHAHPSGPGAGAEGTPGRLRALLWGAAPLSGPFPLWLLVQGAVVATVATAALVGLGAVSAYSSVPMFRDGSAGVVLALAFAVFLLAVRAGKVFVCAVLAVGTAVAVLTPQVTAQLVLDKRGEQLFTEVTEVSSAAAGGASARRFCSVTQVPGTQAPTVTVWRGCTATTVPGDPIALVYDPMGIVPPRGIDPAASAEGHGWTYAGFVAVFLLLSFAAVVLSYPLRSPPHRY